MLKAKNLQSPSPFLIYPTTPRLEDVSAAAGQIDVAPGAAAQGPARNNEFSMSAAKLRLTDHGTVKVVVVVVGVFNLNFLAIETFSYKNICREY